MDRALELGINFFDTANRYGGPKGAGATEEIVGRWFAQGGGRREKVVLATKVFGPMTEWPNDGGLSARHIRAACDESLRRLQTDHIDLYQMHHIDRAAPWDEVWQAMETLVATGQGRLRRQQQLRGLAHRAGERSGEGAALPRPRQRAEPLQPRVAHDRARSAPRVSCVRARRHSVEPARGRHVGRRPAPTPRAARACSRATSRCGPQLERWEKLCADLGEEPAAVALAWLLHQKGVTGPDHRTAHARATRRRVAARRSTSRSTTRRSPTLDEIFPGPGGRAPEAYAW